MFRRTLACLLICLSLPALADAASFTYSTPPAAIKSTYGKTPFQFGYLTVPEDHEDPDGPSIQLAVVILKATNKTSTLAPVFFLTGGPGGSSTGDGPYFEVFAALQKNHDVVLIDQRGTGYSAPFLGINSGTYTMARNRFAAQGINLSAYNTTQNAADIAELRTALGYTNVILFGSSYGTFLAQEVMRSHPDGVAAVVLSGVLPATDTFIPNFNGNALHGLNALFKDVRKTGPARRAFPNFSRTYFDLLKRLKRGPVYVASPGTGKFRITLDDFQGTIQALMQSSERIKIIPLLVTQIAGKRDSKWLRRWFRFSSGARDFSLGMYLSVLGTDWNQPGWLNLTKAADARLKPAIFRQTNAQSSLDVVDAVRIWSLPYNPLLTRQTLMSGIPTLLLAGEMESQTPYDGAKIVAAGLTNRFNLMFPRTGHIAGFTPGPSLSALVQFADNPSRQPVYSLASLKKSRFYLTKVPATVRSSGEERPIKVLR